MSAQARKMHDHHIVCGLGRTGQRVIMKLLDEGAAVVAIDDNPAIVEELRAQGIIAMHGDATSDLALMHAGVTRAQSLAAVTASDAINALICLSAHALSPDLTIIARAEDESSICKLQRAGAMQVIAPASYGGDGIAENMIHPDIARLLPGLQGGDDALEFAELCITEHSPFCDRAISEIGREFPRMVFIAARSHDGTMMLRPPSDRVLTEGEVLVIAGTVGDVAQMRVRRQAA
ncbi:MAG: NAD-binding protein [Planctomycetota bacterium]